jgi:hypothetical protein
LSLAIKDVVSLVSKDEVVVMNVLAFGSAHRRSHMGQRYEHELRVGAVLPEQGVTPIMRYQLSTT